jgi:hypothetical protein
MSRVLFASLTFPGALVAPGHPNKIKEHEKIMRLDQIPTHWNQHIEKLRRKWIAFTNGIVRAIAKELLHVRREEMKEQLRADNQRERSRGASQR